MERFIIQVIFGNLRWSTYSDNSKRFDNKKKIKSFGIIEKLQVKYPKLKTFMKKEDTDVFFWKEDSKSVLFNVCFENDSGLLFVDFKISGNKLVTKLGKE
jgi:hypothetical protein